VAISFINEHDMDKFARIEALIEREVIKLPVPSELGDAPQWKVRQARTKGRSKAKRNYAPGGKSRQRKAGENKS
jgi:hypothetical protein